MDIFASLGELKAKYFDLLNAKDVANDRKRVEEIEDILRDILREIHKIERGR